MATPSTPSVNLNLVLEQVANDKGIDKSVLVATLEDAMQTAAKKHFGQDRNLEAKYDTDKGVVELFQAVTVVEQITYPIQAVNQLTLPVNRPILVHLRTKDVIHSFGLYEMRAKQDAIPGMDIPVWFIPTRVGDYEISCSPLCGLGHFRMRGFVNIKTPAEFQAFLDEEAKNLAK